MVEDRIDELFQAVGRMEGKLDMVLDPRNGLVSQQDHLETRVRSLERRWAWGLGVGSVISTVVAFIASAISFHWSAKF